VTLSWVSGSHLAAGWCLSDPQQQQLAHQLTPTTTATALSCLPSTWSWRESRCQSLPANRVKQVSKQPAALTYGVRYACITPPGLLSVQTRVPCMCIKGSSASHLICVVKLIIHKPGDYTCLAYRLIAQKDLWVGAHAGSAAVPAQGHAQRRGARMQASDNLQAYTLQAVTGWRQPCCLNNGSPPQATRTQLEGSAVHGTNCNNARPLLSLDMIGLICKRGF
jgi:hypothetical protein